MKALKNEFQKITNRISNYLLLNLSISRISLFINKNKPHIKQRNSVRCEFFHF